MSFGDSWISRFLARLSPTYGLAARSCSYGRVFDTPFFQPGLAASALGFSTVGVTPSGHLLSDNKYNAHAGHTRAEKRGAFRRMIHHHQSLASGGLRSADPPYNPARKATIPLSATR